MFNTTTFIATVFLALAVLLLKRRYLLVPFILAACFIPADQRVIIMNLDFTAIRILVLVGALRILLQQPARPIRWNRFDKIVSVWAICGAAIYCLHWFNIAAVINRSGWLFDFFGLYWIFRKNINSWDSIRFNLKIFAICSLFMAGLIAWEWQTGQNPFTVMGRVGTIVRQQRYRCQGPFPHAIMSGLFWATLLPLLAGLAITEKNKVLYWLSAAAATFIVIASASSVPIIVLPIVVVGLFMYKWRQYTSQTLLCLLVLLTGLHLVMNQPVWHLISRVNVIGGSTGWHRYHLINAAIRNFDQWAFIGCRNTANWGLGLRDITNQYILEGVRGGLVTLILFLLVLIYAFRIILTISLTDRQYDRRWLCWCFFLAIMGHCIAFFGVSYFGQIMMLWYMMLAIVGFLLEQKSLLKTVPEKITYRK